MSLFKTKDYSKPKRAKTVYGGGKKQSEEKIIKHIRNLFKLKKNLPVKEYLDKIKPYLSDIIINLQKSDTWKTQLTIVINFISSKYVDEERVMHLESNNIEFMQYDNINEVVNELFESLLSR